MRGCVAVLILNYNNFHATKNCIESVLRFNTIPIKFLIVDNGSREVCLSQLEMYLYEKFLEKYDRIEDGDERRNLNYVSLLVCKTNDGYANGNNKGLKYAYLDDEICYVLILNNDVLFVEDVLPKMVEKYKVMTDCALLSPLLYKRGLQEIDYNCARRSVSVKDIFFNYLFFYFDPFSIKEKTLKEQYYLMSDARLSESCGEFEIELPSGSCMLCSKSLFEKIGGFDPNTFLYFEENILHEKIKKINLKNYILPNVRCVHLGASSTKNENSFFIIKTGVESALYFINEYLGVSRVCKILMFVYLKCVFLPLVWLQKKIKI